MHQATGHTGSREPRAYTSSTKRTQSPSHPPHGGVMGSGKPHTHTVHCLSTTRSQAVEMVGAALSFSAATYAIASSANMDPFTGHQVPSITHSREGEAARHTRAGAVGRVRSYPLHNACPRTHCPIVHTRCLHPSTRTNHSAQLTTPHSHTAQSHRTVTPHSHSVHPPSFPNTVFTRTVVRMRFLRLSTSLRNSGRREEKGSVGRSASWPSSATGRTCTGHSRVLGTGDD